MGLSVGSLAGLFVGLRTGSRKEIDQFSERDSKLEMKEVAYLEIL